MAELSIQPHREYDRASKDACYWRLAFDGGSDFKAGADADGASVLPQHKHEDDDTYKARRSGTPVNGICAEFPRQRRDAVMGATIKRPALESERVDEPFAEWMADVDRAGTGMTAFMGDRLLDGLVERYVWFGIDAGEGRDVETKADEQADPDARTWAVWASPKDVVKWEMDGDRVTRIAIKYEEYIAGDLTTEGEVKTYYREWTDAYHVRYDEGRNEDGGKILTRGEEIPNPFGFVPWFREEPLKGESYAGRFAPRQRAILEARSFLYAEQVACAFTTTILFGVTPEMVGKVALGPGKAMTISNSDARIETVTGRPEVVDKLLDVIKHEIIEANRMSELSNKGAFGITAQSGIAKAYDFKELESLLRSLAQWCQRVENRLIAMHARARGLADEAAAALTTSTYSDSFDTLSAADRFAQYGQVLTSLGFPLEVRRRVMSEVVLMFWPMDSPKRQEMLEAVEAHQETAAQIFAPRQRTPEAA